MKTNFKVLAAAVALMAVASCDEMPGGLNPEKYGDWYNCTLNVPKE